MGRGKKREWRERGRRDKTEKRNEVRVNAVSSLLSGLFPTITSIPQRNFSETSNTCFSL